MKCSSCGLPLSPTRTPINCPRCATPTDASSTTPRPYYQYASWETSRVVDAGGISPQIPHWAQDVQSSPATSPPLQTGQMWYGQVYQPGYSPSPPPRFTPPSGHRNTMLGFIVAGLCILAASLILIFVYFSATGLPGGNSSNLATTTNTNTPNVSTSTPTATVIPSQTATIYPGQQYINHAQMSAAVDPNTLQPSQLTTTFKTGQNIYVSFQVHPNGHGGAVCLIWYLSNKPIINFSLPIRATSKYSYAYAIYGGSGPAYVELYKASSTQCTDKVLAQHVDFTVSN